MLFPKCRECGSQETVAALACVGEPSIPEGTFASLEKGFVPIQDMNKISTLTVKGIVYHYDVCARCGTRRCTKAEILSAPITAQQQSTVRPAGFGKGR